jgi:hypothetical protein
MPAQIAPTNPHFITGHQRRRSPSEPLLPSPGRRFGWVSRLVML